MLLREVACTICDEGSAGFADIARRKRKKNLLVVKASDQDKKATELKNEVT